MSEQRTFSDLFERTVTLPESDSRDRLSRLIGMEDKIKRLGNILGVLVNSRGLEKWLADKHPGATGLAEIVCRRPPLVILSGDVGSGKTELAETIGDRVARQEGIDIELLPLSLSARGQGRVGEMTQLITTAFDHAFTASSKQKAATGKARGGMIMLIDEADALAQSRESAQMHHEDRAGVNALIRGIDRLASAKLPVAVLMCTNRLNALDPAVRRRAADILTFERPNDAQRKELLERFLGTIEFDQFTISRLVQVTGERGPLPGFTYSDLTQRLLPALVLDAYPDKPVAGPRAIVIACAMLPTPPFKDI